jgi:hypothetical protein
MVHRRIFELDLAESRHAVADFLAEEQAFPTSLLLKGDFRAGTQADRYRRITG